MLLINIVTHCTALLLLEARSDPQPYHTSILTGAGWLMELLLGHPDRIHCELGVHKHVFEALVDELRTMGYRDNRSVCLEEQLGIFLYTCVTGLTVRHVGERFQRSNDTVARCVQILILVPTSMYFFRRYFKEMTIIFSSPTFYNRYVKLPTANTPISLQILNDPQYYPFRGALGAIDGSHIHTAPPAAETAIYRNRKGFVSQNCLFVCDFAMKFCYALTGWEGSATDARVYEDACQKGLNIPAGKYLLADAGFPLSLELLIPFRNVRYHLAEWGSAGNRYYKIYTNSYL